MMGKMRLVAELASRGEDPYTRTEAVLDDWTRDLTPEGRQQREGEGTNVPDPAKGGRGKGGRYAQKCGAPTAGPTAPKPKRGRKR